MSHINRINIIVVLFGCGVNSLCLHWVCSLIIGQNLRNFPASWGQVADVDLLTLRLENMTTNTTQKKSASVLTWPCKPYMILKAWVEYFLPGCDFQSQTFVPLIISTETELNWHRAHCLQCICCTTLSLIYSSGYIPNSLVFQKIGLEYNSKWWDFKWNFMSRMNNFKTLRQGR